MKKQVSKIAFQNPHDRTSGWEASCADPQCSAGCAQLGLRWPLTAEQAGAAFSRTAQQSLLEGLQALASQTAALPVAHIVVGSELDAVIWTVLGHLRGLSHMHAGAALMQCRSERSWSEHRCLWVLMVLLLFEADLGQLHTEPP